MTALLIVWALILLAIWWTVRKPPTRGRQIGCKPKPNSQRKGEWELMDGPALRLQEHDILGPLNCLRCGELATACRCLVEHRRYRMALRQSDNRANVVRLR